MLKYFFLQLKRSFKTLPFLAFSILIMLFCIAVVITGFVGKNKNSEDKQRFKIGLTGDLNSQYIDIGLVALQNFDDTRFAMELIKIETENEAKNLMYKGEISAYVVFPPEFIEKALRGDIEKITYVTSTGSQNIVTMFKSEITQFVTDLVVYSQKGAYAISDVGDDYRIKNVNKHFTRLSKNYAKLAFQRSALCLLEELGISSGIGVTEYYVCSVCVIFLSLIGMAFVTVYVSDDHSLNGLLASKGHPISMQVLCEALSHFLALLILMAIIIFLILGILVYLDLKFPYDSYILYSLLLRSVVVAFMISTFNILMFAISGNLVTSVLFYFLGSVGQCYISGCFYPVYALPEILQKASDYFPYGIAREYLEGAFLYHDKLPQLLGIVGYSFVFLLFAVFVRKAITLKGRG